MRNSVKYFLIMLAICCAFGAVAETAKVETPKQGAITILKMLKERNYTDLFHQRYSEWYKVELEGMDPDKALKMLSSRWERNYDTMINLFEQLADSDYTISKTESPQKTETGDVATATVSIGGRKIPYRLYKMKNGLWGFHL